MIPSASPACALRRKVVPLRDPGLRVIFDGGESQTRRQELALALLYTGYRKEQVKWLTEYM